MDVISSPGVTMESLLRKLKKDFKELNFERGSSFYWSAKQQRITYTLQSKENSLAVWSLLHEVAHGLLNHIRYDSDFELLLLEVEAWGKAEELAKTYGFTINSDHIQDCLDTYRDWLYQRSSCPACTNCSLQQNSTTYTCFNCGMSWQVSSSRLCRPYRLVSNH